MPIVPVSLFAPPPIYLDYSIETKSSSSSSCSSSSSRCGTTSSIPTLSIPRASPIVISRTLVRPSVQGKLMSGVVGHDPILTFSDINGGLPTQYMRVSKPTVGSADATDRTVSDRSTKILEYLITISCPGECDEKEKEKHMIHQLQDVIRKWKHLITPESSLITPVELLTFQLCNGFNWRQMQRIRQFMQSQGCAKIPGDNIMRRLVSEMAFPTEQGKFIIKKAETKEEKKDNEEERNIVRHYCRVVNVWDCIAKWIQASFLVGDLVFWDNQKPSTLYISLGGDKGGSPSSTKLHVAIANHMHPNSTWATIPLGMFDGNDHYEELKLAFGPIYDALEKPPPDWKVELKSHRTSDERVPLPSTVINTPCCARCGKHGNGPMRYAKHTITAVELFSTGDMMFQHEELGLSTCGSTYFCDICLLTLDKLRSTAKPHGIGDDCIGVAPLRSLSGMDEMAKKGESKSLPLSRVQSVKHTPLIRFPIEDHIVSPPVHILIGITTDLYNMAYKNVKALDKYVQAKGLHCDSIELSLLEDKNSLERQIAVLTREMQTVDSECRAAGLLPANSHPNAVVEAHQRIGTLFIKRQDIEQQISTVRSKLVENTATLSAASEVGPFERKWNKTLKQCKIRLFRGRGALLNGHNSKKVLRNSQLFMDVVRGGVFQSSTSDGKVHIVGNRKDSVRIEDLMNQLLPLQRLSYKPRPLCEHEIADFEHRTSRLMRDWHTYFPNDPPTPKCHQLSIHMVSFLKRWKTVGHCQISDAWC
jgi:hypothetical protein